MAHWLARGVATEGGEVGKPEGREHEGPEQVPGRSFGRLGEGAWMSATSEPIAPLVRRSRK